MTPAVIRRLRGVERMYLALESPATPMHFGALVVLDAGPLCDAAGRLRLAELRSRVAARLDGLPELRRAVRGAGPFAGGPVWVDDADFRIDRHVDEVHLPPADAAAGEPGLLAFLERRLLATPLDRHLPLWRVTFLTGLDGNRVGVLVVVHHALTDGLGAMQLVGTLLADGVGDAAYGADRHPRPPFPTTPIPGWRALAADHWRSLPRQALALARPEVRRALVETVRAFRAGMRVTRREPPTSLNALVGPHRRLVAQRLDLATVKRVARVHGVGANDLVLALITGGVRALLAGRGEPIERSLPRAGLAVTLPPSERRDAGNHFGGFVVPLPINERDPLAQMCAAARAREAAKRSQGVSQMTGVRIWTARFAPTRWLMRRQRVINLMETFVPGPPRPITLLGAPVLDLVPIQPLGRNVGLTFLASSYAGCLTVAIRTDPDAFPDLDLVTAGMTASWDSILGRTAQDGRSNMDGASLTSTLGSGAPAGRRPEGRCDGSRARRAGTARGPGGVRRPRPRAR